MRPIKFRAKKYGGEWHYFGIDELTELINRDTIGQFTGLLDKNEKEIYEGDLVKGWIPDTERDEDLPIGEIRFEEAGFDIWLGNRFLGSLAACTLNKSVEVIGNICENPELM